jgi:hypothetical protein
MQANKVWKESEMKTKDTEESERHFCNDETFDENHFCDSCKKIPLFREDFFYCFEDEEFENNEQYQGYDLLNLDYVHHAGIMVEFDL